MRALAALLLLALHAAPAAASEPVMPPTVWTVFTTVDVDVVDDWATVRVIADIANRGPDPEFPFRVAVPDDAFVSGLTLERDGEVHEARIAPREEARQEYDAHKAREETGGLVEKTRGASVYAFLINVAARTDVRATLTYEVYLPAVEGEHRLALEAPVSGFGEDTGARFDVRVRHDDGVTGLWSDATSGARDGDTWRLVHEVGPRSGDAPTKLDVAYTTRATAEAGSLAVVVEDGVGYFAHRFRAPDDARTLPLDLVLVLDTSGSMSGLKMQQMQDAAAQLVRSLKEGDRLQLVAFSDDATATWSEARAVDPAARREAADEIAGLISAGGTNMEAGIRRGFEAFDAMPAGDERRLPLLVFLTDGQPTVGTTDRQALRELARDANDREAGVWSLAFGQDADWGMVRALAEDGRGRAIRVAEGEGAEVDLRRFLVALATPVLKDVHVEYDDEVDPYGGTASVLFAGSEILVVGTFDPAMDAVAGTVHATAPDGPRTYAFREAVGDADRLRHLPRLVAYQEIRRLQEVVAAEGRDPDTVARATQLALDRGFVTDFTSLVLTLDPRGDPEPMMDRADAFDRDDAASSTVGAPASTGWTGRSSSGTPTRSTSHGSGMVVGEPAEHEPSAAVPATGVALVALAAIGVALARGRR